MEIKDMGIRYLLGNDDTIINMPAQKAFVPFSKMTLEFLNKWSLAIREHVNGRKYSDVVSFAFWIRYNSLLNLKKTYDEDLERRISKGLALHFAPSNIPVLFAFSMTASLLAGNTVILRMPAQMTQEALVIIEALRKVLEVDEIFSKRIVILKYEHNPEITDYLSTLCNIRVIWGGDHSVAEIRKSPLKERAVDIPFADRYSMSVIDSEKFLAEENRDLLLRAFFNDTYLNDQNACSAPSMILWYGSRENGKKASEIFFKELTTVLDEKKYEVSDHLAVKKLEKAYLYAASHPCRIISDDNRTFRIRPEEMQKDFWDYLCPGGYFFEFFGNETDLHKLITDKCQTMTCYGVDRSLLAEKILEDGIKGIDRITEFGHALDFELVWDGVDLIRTMTREIRY